MDIFKLNPKSNTLEPIARGKISHIRDNEAVLKIEEYYKSVEIEKGFTAKKPLQ